jgi:hypothetical protein
MGTTLRVVPLHTTVGTGAVGMPRTRTVVPSSPACTTVARMPSRVLVHYPEPATPHVETCWFTGRPPRGEEFPPGWTVCDYNLVRGDWEGEEYTFEVWVEPITNGSGGGVD